MIRSEKRRVRRGRLESVQQGQGHGDRTYLPVLLTNRMAFDEDARKQRRERLGERDRAVRAYVNGLAKARVSS